MWAFAATMNVMLAPKGLAYAALNPFCIANAVVGAAAAAVVVVGFHIDWIVGDRILPFSINAFGLGLLIPSLNAVAYCSRPLHYVRILLSTVVRFSFVVHPMMYHIC